MLSPCFASPPVTLRVQPEPGAGALCVTLPHPRVSPSSPCRAGGPGSYVPGLLRGLLDSAENQVRIQLSAFCPQSGSPPRVPADLPLSLVHTWAGAQSQRASSSFPGLTLPWNIAPQWQAAFPKPADPLRTGSIQGDSKPQLGPELFLAVPLPQQLTKFRGRDKTMCPVHGFSTRGHYTQLVDSADSLEQENLTHSTHSGSTSVPGQDPSTDGPGRCLNSLQLSPCSGEATKPSHPRA